MSEQTGEYVAVRERIAEALRENLSRSDTRHLKSYEAAWAAEAVLDALGLEQVGWMGPYGIVPGGLDVEPVPHWRPIYMAHIGSSVEDQ